MCDVLHRHISDRQRDERFDNAPWKRDDAVERKASVMECATVNVVTCARMGAHPRAQQERARVTNRM